MITIITILIIIIIIITITDFYFHTIMFKAE